MLFNSRYQSWKKKQEMMFASSFCFWRIQTDRRLIKKQFEDTRGVIRSRKSNQDRQHNNKTKKDERTNNHEYTENRNFSNRGSVMNINHHNSFEFDSRPWWGVLDTRLCDQVLPVNYSTLTDLSGDLCVFCCNFSILCCVFLRLVYPKLPVYLDYPFLIAPSVFSNVYIYFIF
jgi:hypothetical protein